MRLAKWTRTDQLALEGLLWALPAVALVQLVVQAVSALRGAPLEIAGSLPDDLVRTPELVVGPLTGTVVVPDATAAQYGWGLAPMVVVLVLAVVVARLLLGVARSLRTGDPFTRHNARRLSTLSFVIIVGGVLLPLLEGIAFEAVVGPLLQDGARTWHLDLHAWPLLTGALVAFLAEVFVRGARLREDVEGLV